ncbi:hypothetical protein YC2023_059850 [Brassica napus]
MHLLLPPTAIPKKKAVSRLRQPNPRSSSSLVQCPYSIDDFLELLKNNGNPIDDLMLLKSMYTKFRIRLFQRKKVVSRVRQPNPRLFQRKKVVSRVRKPNPRSSSSLVQCPYSIDDFWELLKNKDGRIESVENQNAYILAQLGENKTR